MKILVGSTAAKQWFPDFRTPNDIDYFVTPDQMGTQEQGTEYFYHPALLNYFEENEEGTLLPDNLYTLKVSHAFWQLKNRSWDKHMHDIVFFQSKGLQFNTRFYEVLYPIWEEVHGVKRANLNQEPDKFFNAAVDRKYDHDSIHDSVAYYDEPLFNKILRDGHKVAVDRSKFESLSHEDKCRLVREEVYATALERVLIPSNYTASPRAAYNYALRQTITSYSKGWFPLWIVLNFSELRTPDIDFVKKHKENADRLILL